MRFVATVYHFHTPLKILKTPKPAVTNRVICWPAKCEGMGADDAANRFMFYVNIAASRKKHKQQLYI